MRLSGGNFVRSICGKGRRVLWTVALCTLVLFSLAFCYHWFVGPGTRPPDLSSCTRLEIRYPRSALNYFLPATDLQKSILSPDEKVRLQSIESSTVSELPRIKAFAYNVGLGTYGGRLRTGWTIMQARPVVVHCYRDSKRILSFTVLIDRILTEDHRIFEYPEGSPNLEIIEPAEMREFKLRYQCGLNMQRLRGAGPLYHGDVNTYPDPSEWCDATIRDRTNTSYMSDKRMTEMFKCPAAGEGRSNYAMNSNCTPDSAADMVLLFETKAGWNQHGGPELFTFDNHDPKGGCVLSNDGTVKFIRTEEGLQGLQWK